MKRFRCDCGSQIFFDNDYCLSCGGRLGFDPGVRELRTLAPAGDGIFTDRNGRAYRFCANGEDYGVCNWLRPAEQVQPLCFGCQFNRIVPNQSLPENDRRWRVLEAGKKRLFFTLMQQGLPLVNGWEDKENGLLFDFMEDGRSHELFAETFAATGYLGGVITINTLEADDVARTVARSQMNEGYRTVLGHLRHESGHYYWQRLNADEEIRAEFKALFGDQHRDYSSALAAHYANGPALKWRECYISAYASAHPVEDWAECWGHYLHIYDALETAAAQGMVGRSPDTMDMRQRIHAWRGLSTTLNELNRSVGLGDAYPFVINELVAKKITFVDSVIRRLRA